MWDHPTRPGIAMQEARYTRVPNVLHALVASSREYQLVALLLSYRWYPDSPIIPSTGTLAAAMGCSQRTVRRTVAAIEARGYIRREERRAPDRRQMSNLYVLCGVLLEAVTALDAPPGREERQAWPGRRTALLTERETRKHEQPKQRQSTRRYSPGDLMVSRYGRVRRHGEAPSSRRSSVVSPARSEASSAVQARRCAARRSRSQTI